MGGQIDMEWKGSKSIWYWKHYLTLGLNITRDTDLQFPLNYDPNFGFSRYNVSNGHISPMIFQGQIAAQP